MTLMVGSCVLYFLCDILEDLVQCWNLENIVSCLRMSESVGLLLCSRGRESHANQRPTVSNEGAEYSI